MKLKLTIDTIPSSTWHKNIRNGVPRKAWEKIRRHTFDVHGRKCIICGFEGPRIACHELWEFDFDAKVQRLLDFVPLCGLCHSVKHFGLTQILAKKGKIDMKRVIKHFLKVNGCRYNDFVLHLTEVKRKVTLKNSLDWTLEIKGRKNSLADIVNKKKE